MTFVGSAVVVTVTKVAETAVTMEPLAVMVEGATAGQ